jgi:putative phosphoesterase
LPRGSRLPDACLELIRSAELLLHTGDITTREALADLRAIGPPVRAVRGNVDEPTLAAELPERVVLEWDGLRIGLVHDAGRAADRHGRLRDWFPGCDLVAYGHTHAPETARVGGVWIVNPGSPTERRRAPARTMAVVEMGCPSLVTLP